MPIHASGLNNAFDTDILAPAANGYNTGETNDIYQIIGTIISSVLSLLGVIFIIMIVYGGIIWMTAEGDESRVEKAQNIIRDATIGLIITLSAYAISFFVINTLTKLK